MMDDEGLALLKELVEDCPTSYNVMFGEIDDTICAYCGASEYDVAGWPKVRDWRIDHYADCPIAKAREYLKRIESK